MTDEPKDVRLPFMVTASEAKAIDEWRYANHIPSRAEAMRLLINRGIILEDFQNVIMDLSLLVFKQLKDGRLSEEEIATYTGAVNHHSRLIKNNTEFEYKTSETIRDQMNVITESLEEKMR